MPSIRNAPRGGPGIRPPLPSSSSLESQRDPRPTDQKAGQRPANNTPQGHLRIDCSGDTEHSLEFRTHPPRPAPSWTDCLSHGGHYDGGAVDLEAMCAAGCNHEAAILGKAGRFFLHLAQLCFPPPAQIRRRQAGRIVAVRIAEGTASGTSVSDPASWPLIRAGVKMHSALPLFVGRCAHRRSIVLCMPAFSGTARPQAPISRGSPNRSVIVRSFASRR
jgi:hypothetical protein